MMIKNQKGVALIVALMITVIIGIIAISLASMTARGQKSDNSNYGRIIGSSNAVSGVNRSVNFLQTIGGSKLVTPEQREHLLNSENPAADVWSIGSSQTVDTRLFFRGIGQRRSNAELDANGNAWYRDPDMWTRAKCPKCVILNDGTTVYYTELRSSSSNGGNGPDTSVNNNDVIYNYYRITSRGLDRQNNHRSASVIQTHVKIRDN